MKKIKISELPLYQSLKGLFVMGTDVNNRSVKVNLEFIEARPQKPSKPPQKPQRKPQPLQSQQPIKCLTRSERLFLRACLLRAFPA